MVKSFNRIVSSRRACPTLQGGGVIPVRRLWSWRESRGLRGLRGLRERLCVLKERSTRMLLRLRLSNERIVHAIRVCWVMRSRDDEEEEGNKCAGSDKIRDGILFFSRCGRRVETRWLERLRR